MATFYGASDIDVMLSEFGVPVEVISAAGVSYTGMGVVDTTDEDRLSVDSTSMTGTFMALIVKTDVFVGLAEGVTVTVDGTDYIALRTMRVDDGALTRVMLQEA